MSEKPSGNWGKIALLNAAVAAWLIYDIATSAETPSQMLMILQYVLLAGSVLGLGSALFKLTSR